MKFSIVMPSYLGFYPSAALNREEKIVRAVSSILGQTFPNWELIVVADGCTKTVDIISGNFDDPRIKGYYIDKQTLWSGVPRNVGIAKSDGDYIMYLDIDDTYNLNYLEGLAPLVGDLDWYWVDEYSFNMETGQFDVHRCDITRFAKCGTSNVIHRKIAALWPEKKAKYDHDWQFIQSLKRASKRYGYLPVVGYEVRHVPNLLDV